MSAGDLNAWVALIGFAGGVATGSFFLKKGFSLGRAYEAKPVGGAVLPVLLAALLVIGVATGAYAASTEGPGSKHAPIILLWSWRSLSVRSRRRAVCALQAASATSS
ncbi:MAG: hypothetical protein ACLT4C_04965 [Butyricicoccus sp.]